MRFEDVPANARWALNGESDIIRAEFSKDGGMVIAKFSLDGKPLGVSPMRPLTDSEYVWNRDLSRDEAAKLLSAAAEDTVIAMNSKPQSPKLSPAMKAALERGRRSLAALAADKAKGLPLPKVP